MSTPDEFRKQAEECHQLAAEAAGPDRAFWLALAADWIALADEVEKIAMREA